MFLGIRVFLNMEIVFRNMGVKPRTCGVADAESVIRLGIMQEYVVEK